MSIDTRLTSLQSLVNSWLLYYGVCELENVAMTERAPALHQNDLPSAGDQALDQSATS
jgi:hypothetical protein